MKHLKMLLCILLSLCTAIGLSGCGNGRQNAGSETGPPPISETDKSQTSEVMSEAADKPKDAVDGSVAGSNMMIAYFSWANNAEEYNLDDYNVIFPGFPDWWYTIPVAIDSFVAEHDLFGKTVIPFVSHGTGGLAGTIRDLTAILPDDCTLLQSYDVYEDDIPSAQDEVNAWLEVLGC